MKELTNSQFDIDGWEDLINPDGVESLSVEVEADSRGDASRQAEVRGSVGTDESTNGANAIPAENSSSYATGTNPLAREQFITTARIRCELVGTETAG